MVMPPGAQATGTLPGLVTFQDQERWYLVDGARREADALCYFAEAKAFVSIGALAQAFRGEWVNTAGGLSLRAAGRVFEWVNGDLSVDGHTVSSPAPDLRYAEPRVWARPVANALGYDSCALVLPVSKINQVNFRRHDLRQDPEVAITWAQSQATVNPGQWLEWCLGFVQQAFRVAGFAELPVDASTPDPTRLAEYYSESGLLDRSCPAPRGALILYGPLYTKRTYYPEGHVAISLGGDKIINPWTTIERESPMVFPVTGRSRYYDYESLRRLEGWRAEDPNRLGLSPCADSSSILLGWTTAHLEGR
jgi:cell wall-associated NlpC family hydrolase